MIAAALAQANDRTAMSITGKRLQSPGFGRPRIHDQVDCDSCDTILFESGLPVLSNSP